MNKRFSQISFLCLLVVCCMVWSNAYAQTYRNGTWYALYDDSEHTMNTQGDYETGGIFAPTNGTLNVKWRYEWIDLFGAFREIDTEVLESADNGANTRKVGDLAENTDKNSNTTEAFNVSRNINWIKFNRSGVPTHKVVLYHLDIPLAYHILLPSGIYGTTSGSHDFGEQDAMTTSEAYTIQLRSFLSAGNITVTSSDPQIFRVGENDNVEPLVFAVGNNACASANGTAEKASEGNLADIANYTIPVYFRPLEGKDYEATLTISDGTSTAVVSLSGQGKKLTQVIVWEPPTPVYTSATIPAAIASSGLPVDYTFAPEGIVELKDGAFAILSEGEVQITASQAGNEVFKPAESVTKTIVIYPAETHFQYSATICEGESYSDEHFNELSVEKLYFDTLVNRYGSDSIICLSLNVLPRYDFEQTDEIFIGAEVVWQGFDLSAMPVGDTVLVAKYNTVLGCDSVYTLRLTVNEPPTTYGKDSLYICARGELVYYDNTPYSKPTDSPISVTLSILNRFGGDSIVELTILPSIKYDISFSKMIYQGMEVVWQGIDLSTMPLGDTTLIASYSTVLGCDSIHTLHLSVVTPPATYVNNYLELCEGDTAYLAGKAYFASVRDSVRLATQNECGGDSVMLVEVEVHPVSHFTETKTITEEESVEWQGFDLSTMPVGDTTLVATYTSEHGCDSTYTLRLTVLVKSTEGFEDTNVTPSAVKLIRNGQLFIRKGDDYYDVFGRKVHR